MATTPQEALRPLDKGALDALVGQSGGPLVSLYMPTHRKGANTRENAIRFRTRLKQAEKDLAAHDKKHGPDLVAPLAGLIDSYDFWQHQLAGLAVFRGPDTTTMFRLPRPVPELTVVSDSFYVKPLLRIMQDPDRYQLLAVTQNDVRLYEGTRDTLDEVPLDPQVPRTIVEALGDEVTGELNVHSYGGLSHSGMFHGHHDNRDDRDMDLERYFRIVDKAVYDYHGRGGDLPLYLAADVDYHDRYRKVSHHPRLTEQGLRLNPAAVEIDTERLRREMDDLLRQARHDRAAKLVEQYGLARSRRQGTDDLSDIARAAAEGRVQTLLLQADRLVPGTVDPVHGTLKLARKDEDVRDDVLDDVAEMVLRQGGEVRILPADVHPATDSGAAAIFRY